MPSILIVEDEDVLGKSMAAALSDDGPLWETYTSGDPYITFAKMANLVPDDATKASHPEMRARCKVLMLGANYGMRAFGLAQRAEIHLVEAQELMSRYASTYRIYTRWIEDLTNQALIGNTLVTRFGWPIHLPLHDDINANTYRNFPCQANGAEMMRIAAILATEAGLKICAPIHDAFLLEAPLEEIEAETARLKQIMIEASELVLGPGKQCRVDATIWRYPDRYMDDRGGDMWTQVVALARKLKTENGSFPPNAENKGGRSSAQTSPLNERPPTLLSICIV